MESTAGYSLPAERPEQTYPVAAPPPSRTPFSDLGQVEADLALASTLQEQEVAYAAITCGWMDEEDSDGEVLDESQNLLPAFDSGDAYTREVQDAVERDMAARLLRLASRNEQPGERRGHGNDSQAAWHSVDPDDLSYEELVALGDVAGTMTRGLSADGIASLPSVSYKAESAKEGDRCTICQFDYEDGDVFVELPCKHRYHSECINKWLQINKVCPLCNTKISSSLNQGAAPSLQQS